MNIHLAVAHVRVDNHMDLNAAEGASASRLGQVGQGRTECVTSPPAGRAVSKVGLKLCLGAGGTSSAGSWSTANIYLVVCPLLFLRVGTCVFFSSAVRPRSRRLISLSP